MKKLLFLLLITLMFGCNSPQEEKDTTVNETPREEVNEEGEEGEEVEKEEKEELPSEPKKEEKKYENQRFRNVTVEKTGTDTYRIKGQGQIFEANFGYVVEDGHNELLTGHHMTDAGAPEWGNFDFNIKVKKQNPHSTLHLILFESSAKDGSRVYELFIPLPE